MKAVVVGGNLASRVARILSDDGVETTHLSDLPSAMYAGELIVGCGSWDPDEEVDVARAALKSGSSYISASHDPENVGALLSLSEEATEGGVTLLAGMSWTPGVTALMAKMGLAEVAAAEGVAVSWIVPPSPQTLPWVAGALSGTAAVFTDGSWHRREAGGGPEKIYLPEPIGWKTVRLARGAEAVTLPRNGNLKEVIVRGGTGNTVADRLVDRVIQASELAAPTRRARLARLAAAGARIIAGSGDKAGWSAVRVDVFREGEIATFGLLDQISNLTSVPLAVAAKLVAGGEIAKPGAWSSEQLLEPRTFLSHLSQRGIRVARLVRDDGQPPQDDSPRG